MIETIRPLAARRERFPDRREHVLVNLGTADGFRYSAALSYVGEGSLAEIVLNAEKFGTTAVLGTLLALRATQPRLGAEPMSRRRRLPDRGDVAASAVADLLPLSRVTSDSHEPEVREGSR
jgi:hypothetical protein